MHLHARRGILHSAAAAVCLGGCHARNPVMHSRLLPLLLGTLAALAVCAADAVASETTPATAAAPVPPAPEWLAGVERLYDTQLRVPGLESRTFSPGHWWQVAGPLLAGDAGFRVEEIGRSAEGRPLRHVQWGEGETRVLMWSQMHGDESTATMALPDLFHFLGSHPEHPIVARLRENTTLHFFPLVNPDGAARFQRRNAQGIDINRDARALATPERRALKSLRDRIKPDLGFNLHDQRPGYRAGDSDRGVAIALLAPRGASRVHVGSCGFEGDPEKQAERRLNALGLASAQETSTTGTNQGTPTGRYTVRPENGSVWPHLKISGATLFVPGSQGA